VTRLPVDTWEIYPRLDIPPYELNTVCPVTGETSGLEDHHIWRRSFTALGEPNRDLFWVEYQEYDDLGFETDIVLARNRVALSRDAHERITTNRARLEYRGEDLYYIEGEEEKKLDLNLRLMEGSEKVTKRRKPAASTPEERKARVNFTIKTPPGEEQIIPELVQQAREAWAGEMGWSDNVPAHYVTVAAFVRALQ
jgi:hypothetical protein